MSWVRRSGRPRVWRIFAAGTLSIFFLILLRFPNRLWYDRRDQEIVAYSQTVSGTRHVQNTEVQQYWRVLRDHLRDLTPRVAPIKMRVHATHDNKETDTSLTSDQARLDLIKLPEEAVKRLQQGHDSFVNLTITLAPGLPYNASTRGIVTTAGGKYFNIVILSLRMLRRTGSQLPVVVFLDTPKDYDEYVCDELFPRLNAECVLLSDLFATARPSIPLEKYQYKVFALLFSPFQEVLFMDADAFPVHNPDELFSVEPFKSTGMVTWPDFWDSTAAPAFYDITRIPVPSLAARKTSEAGILMYDKSRHARDLLLALFYNFFGPKWYYPLLSQGAEGEGDKDTFLHAALAVGAPCYDVKTAVKVVGRWLNGTWHSAGMKQADPREDWKLSKASAAGSKDLRFRSNNAKASRKESENKNKKTSKGTEIAAQPFFIHNNIVKVDVEQLVEPDSVVMETNGTGSLQRLWGPRAAMIQDFGYDVERGFWEEMAIAGCQLMSRRDCNKILKIAEGVLGEKLIINQLDL